MQKICFRPNTDDDDDDDDTTHGLCVFLYVSLYDVFMMCAVKSSFQSNIFRVQFKIRDMPYTTAVILS